MAYMLPNGIRVPGGSPATPSEGFLYFCATKGAGCLMGIDPLPGQSTKWEPDASW